MNREKRTLSPAEIDAQAADWIVRRDSGLSRAEQAEFARWHAEDPRHAEALTRHDQAWALLDRPRAAGRGREMARALPARVARRRRRRATAAATALALSLAAWALFSEPTREIPSGLAAGSSVILEPRKQTLPDGSVVELRDGAEIVLAYSEHLRRVSLRGGEALFHVAKEPARPFIVTAAGLDVRAIGTVFLVQLAGEKLDVIVTEGQVAVEKAEPSAPGRMLPPAAWSAPEASTLVAAGARLTIDQGAAAPLPPVIDISPDEIAARLAWRTPFLEFTEVPLAEAVEVFNRYSAVRLVVEDEGLAVLPVNGRFRADNSETLVRLLESSFGVSASRRGEVLVLRRTSTGG